MPSSATFGADLVDPWVPCGDVEYLRMDLGGAVVSLDFQRYAHGDPPSGGYACASVIL